jgi:hypothetical protein
MSQNPFASELTKFDLPLQGPGALASRALSRNRRRVRVLSALTIALWAITFLMVPALWMPFAAKMKHLAIGLDQTISAHPTTVDVESVAQVLREVCLYVAMVSGAILAIMTIASLLAAISTVWLVLTVRRVTLEQISMGLAQISQQLARLESTKGGGRS